ncbi:unnamed protein product [Prorocentrum cordatum]|uniref:Uncharacterized protein n=1 Tax=Prorocentrum cordatum TaxID=2364126 RepID=A0ABN9W196_9DINO|nr:unnamed protein product [Polarella glacialis]
MPVKPRKQVGGFSLESKPLVKPGSPYHTALPFRTVLILALPMGRVELPYGRRLIGRLPSKLCHYGLATPLDLSWTLAGLSTLCPKLLAEAVSEKLARQSRAAGSRSSSGLPSVALDARRCLDAALLGDLGPVIAGRGHAALERCLPFLLVNVAPFSWAVGSDWERLGERLQGLVGEVRIGVGLQAQRPICLPEGAFEVSENRAFGANPKSVQLLDEV